MIPKGGRDYCGIGLVEVVWKAVTLIINCLFTTSLHDSLHGLQMGRGTCNTSLEAKLIHQLTATREEVLYAIFLDLHKAYGALDREKFLEILGGTTWDLKTAIPFAHIGTGYGWWIARVDTMGRRFKAFGGRNMRTRCTPPF